MKVVKVLVIIVGVLFVILLGSLMILKLVYPQKALAGYEINDQNMEDHVLIVSQGSDYKMAVISNVTENYKAYYKVVDISKLSDIESENWDAMIIFATIEASTMPKHVVNFIDTFDNKEKLIVAVTAGDADWKTDEFDLDVISTVSKTENIEIVTMNILGRLSLILSQE